MKSYVNRKTPCHPFYNLALANPTISAKRPAKVISYLNGNRISNGPSKAQLCVEVWWSWICNSSGFFPTCPVRVVRFYKSCPPSSPPSPPPSPAPRRPPLCRHLRRHLRQLYVAMGSAGTQLQAADRVGQRRTSIGSAGLQRAAPDLNRGARAEQAAPDLTREAPERSGQRKTSLARKKMPEDMSEKNVKRYVRKECQKICQKKCQKRQ